MKKALAFIMLALCLILSATTQSHAHSRAGLEKVTLYTEVPTPDHLAFYLEAYVNQRKGEDGRGNRFFLMDFEKVEMEGNKALVHGEVVDQKKGSTTIELFTFVRNKDESWNHVDADGKLIEKEVYTMVEPDKTKVWRYGGAAVLILLLIGINIRRMLKKKKAAK